MIGHPFIMSPNMAANIVQLNAFHNYKYTDEIAFFYSKNCESDRYNNLAET